MQNRFTNKTYLELISESSDVNTIPGPEHIKIHTCTYVYIYMYAHIHAYIHTYLCMQINMHAYIHIYINIQVHATTKSIAQNENNIHVYVIHNTHTCIQLVCNDNTS